MKDNGEDKVQTTNSNGNESYSGTLIRWSWVRAPEDPLEKPLINGYQWLLYFIGIIMSKITPQIAKRIKNRPYYAFLYAKNILKGRLPEKYEIVFVKDPQSAYLYAKHVMKGRLPEYVHNGLLISSFEKNENKQYHSMYLKEFC